MYFFGAPTTSMEAAPSGATVTMTYCSIDSNTAGIDGGGVHAAFGGTTLLTDCSITDNTAGDDGGGVSLADGDVSGLVMTLTDCLIDGNKAAEYGGGVHVFIFSSNARLRVFVLGCTFTRNFAERGAGLLIEDNGDSYVTVTGCSIHGNKARFDGGGVYIAGEATAMFTDINIYGNNARDGGGVYIDGSPRVSFMDCNISGNIAGTNGENLYISTSSVPGPSVCLYETEVTSAFSNETEATGGIITMAPSLQQCLASPPPPPSPTRIKATIAAVGVAAALAAKRLFGETSGKDAPPPPPPWSHPTDP